MATRLRGRHCSVVVGSRFIYAIRTNRLETTENKTLKVDFHSLFRGPQVPGEGCMQSGDIIHANSALTGFRQVKNLPSELT